MIWKVRSNEAYFVHLVQLNYLIQFHHLKCHVYYFASESHRQRCIADGAIKETDWTPALAKSARRQSDWSCSRLALHILCGTRCREHSAILRVAPDQMPHPPNPLAAAATTLWHGRAGAAWHKQEREIACFKRFRQPLFPPTIKGSTYRIIFGRFILSPLWA